MTGTNRSKTFMEFDSNRNQEWLRRRKLRLEQVRKQSNEIAKALRQKVINDEKARREKYDKMSEEKFRDWKAEKLNELERRLKCALSEFGEGYKLAEAEPMPVIEEKIKENLAKAQKRGKIAKQEELKKKKMTEEKKMIPIQRKIMTRKREDLRSALVRSLVLKKQLIDAQEVCTENEYHEKVPLKKKRKKKTVCYKPCICNHHATVSEISPFSGEETIWINLNNIQTSSTGDSELQRKSNKSFTTIEKNQKGKFEGTVEYYDFSARYHCRSFREFPLLVERIDPESQVLNANELAKLEDEMEKEEIKKKMAADSVTKERGMEAFRREKIKRDYNNLMAKLEELNKKEKILKTQQRIPPNFLHMDDERLNERIRTKQRIMETEFEKIYYEATSRISRIESPQLEDGFTRGGGDYVESDNRTSVRLSFSPSNLKFNTPVTSDEEFSSDSSQKKICRRWKKTKRRRQLLSDIDKALKEGRALRKTIAGHRDVNISEYKDVEEEKEELSSSSKTVEARSVESSPLKDEGKSAKSEESKSEDLKDVEESAEENSLKGFDKTGDESLPASSSTSYKSPPNEIRTYRLRQVLDYLEKVSQVEDDTSMQSDSKFKRKMEKLLQDLTNLGNYNKSEEKNKKSCASPTLAYYIEKLLSLSREYIANLSVSSENVSTPKITDLDVKYEKAPKAEYFGGISSKGEDLIRNSRLERATQLEEVIKNWKNILEKNSEEIQPKVEGFPDYPRPGLVEEVCEIRPEEAFRALYSPKIKNKYEEITKKCSARISELSNMLDKVRKDKEKLFGSASDGSNLNSCKDDGISEQEFGAKKKEELSVQVGSSEKVKTSPALDDFINRYNLARPRKEFTSTSEMVDSQSPEEHEESLESWPDVMDELLRREILTSPFKWSDDTDYSSEYRITDDNRMKPPSVETAIGNFRKEIGKIKRFSLSGSFSQSNTSEKLRHASDKEFKELFCRPNKRSSCWGATENEQLRQEESSVESINYALTRLGLNWAKSFLRKNEESRAMSSSSNSEEKCLNEENHP